MNRAKRFATTLVLAATIAAFFSTTSFAATDPLAFPFVPDSHMTTGSYCTTQDPNFSEYRYAENIPYCKRSVSSRTKQDIYRSYGVPKKCQVDYTIDHFIPLSLGGTNHVDNLWPEPKQVKALRQNMEYELYEDVRDGKKTRQEAVDILIEAKLNPPVQDPTTFSICL